MDALNERVQVRCYEDVVDQDGANKSDDRACPCGPTARFAEEISADVHEICVTLWPPAVTACVDGIRHMRDEAGGL